MLSFAAKLWRTGDSHETSQLSEEVRFPAWHIRLQGCRDRRLRSNPAVRHTYSGRGIANGDTLAIFIGDRLQGDHNGVFLGEYLVVYRLQPDGSLSGSWVYANGSDEGSETLRPK